jgi:hypothetical protein
MANRKSRKPRVTPLHPDQVNDIINEAEIRASPGHPAIPLLDEYHEGKRLGLE